jgi:hypothetical protein
MVYGVQPSRSRKIVSAPVQMQSRAIVIWTFVPILNLTFHFSGVTGMIQKADIPSNPSRPEVSPVPVEGSEDATTIAPAVTVAKPPATAARGAQNYFIIATCADADSYFFMNLLVYPAALSIASVLALTSCTTDDDPFTVQPAAATIDSEAPAPVAGAETPPPESSSGGWKW